MQSNAINIFRARAHWPLCLAKGGRVFVADPSTLGRHVAATAKFPNNRKKCARCRTQPQKRSVCGGD